MDSILLYEKEINIYVCVDKSFSSIFIYIAGHTSCLWPKNSYQLNSYKDILECYQPMWISHQTKINSCGMGNSTVPPPPKGGYGTH